MKDIIEAASTPLGIVALALLLLFSLIPASPRARRYPVVVAICIAGCAVIIIGGLFYALSNPQVKREATLPPTTVINQQTGDKSPAVSDTKGNVTIIIDDSRRGK